MCINLQSLQFGLNSLYQLRDTVIGDKVWAASLHYINSPHLYLHGLNTM